MTSASTRLHTAQKRARSRVNITQSTCGPVEGAGVVVRALERADRRAAAVPEQVRWREGLLLAEERVHLGFGPALGPDQLAPAWKSRWRSSKAPWATASASGVPVRDQVGAI